MTHWTHRTCWHVELWTYWTHWSYGIHWILLTRTDTGHPAWIHSTRWKHREHTGHPEHTRDAELTFPVCPVCSASFENSSCLLCSGCPVCSEPKVVLCVPHVLCVTRWTQISHKTLTFYVSRVFSEFWEFIMSCVFSMFCALQAEHKYHTGHAEHRIHWAHGDHDTIEAFEESSDYANTCILFVTLQEELLLAGILPTGIM